MNRRIGFLCIGNAGVGRQCALNEPADGTSGRFVAKDLLEYRQ